MKTTTDLWFASYLVNIGLELKNYKKLNNKKVQFEFEIADNHWASLRVKYFNSDISKYRQAQERLKDLLY